MEKKELDKILELHKKWLNYEVDGVRANLRNANLRYADLSNADLSNADLSGANLRNANLSGADLSNADLKGVNPSNANLRYADLSNADLRGVNLSNADLKGVNLRGADLDFSCLPLWCGSLSANFDDKQLKQIAYHLVKAGLQSKNASEKTKRELEKLIDFANGFHRVSECGIIEKE